MNTLLIMSNKDSMPYMMAMVRSAMRQYEKSCYISFNETYNVILDMLGRTVPGVNMFVVIDASPKSKKKQTISQQVYVIPITELFNVYLFLRQLIIDEGIQYLLIDSLSALIRYHPDLPLKEMMINLILEIGKLGCDSTIAVEQKDEFHEVVKQLMPLIKKQIYL
jgi:hypothetical protein